MNILAISANFPRLVLALQTEKGCYTAETLDSAVENSLPKLENLLAEANLKMSNLDKIFVAAGPGSFTGIRMGFAIAQGAHFLQGIPFFGISNFQILAQISGHKDLLAAIPTGRGDYYAQEFVAGKPLEPNIISLLQVAQSKKLVVGMLDAELIKMLQNEKQDFLEIEEITGSMIIKAASQLSDNSFISQPLYVRPPYAC
jgi:tRNA threonylcarbamoyl adenosine modification protein YeaZ